MPTLKPEDYLEPNCPLENPNKASRDPIPQQRISAKIDELMAKGQYEQLETVLAFWKQSALMGNDPQGEFFLYNEMMGIYRKIPDREKAYQAVEQAMAMLPVLGYEDAISGATCYVNAATVYTSFDEPLKALPLFNRALEIYRNTEADNRYRIAAVLNNKASAVTALQKYDEAIDLYQQALEILEDVDNSALEKAMSHLNIIDVLLSRDGVDQANDETITGHLVAAQMYLDDETVERDDYYSFVCDKCVSIFDFFGWSGYADELRERIKAINERS